MAIRTEKITIYGEDSSPYEINVIVDDALGGLAIDYTQSINDLNLHLDRIATALEPSDSSILADNLSNSTNTVDLTEIIEQVTRVADSLETTDNSPNIADNISTIRKLGESTGIRTDSPYEYLTLISIYKLLIEENKLFDTTRSISETEKDQIKQKLAEYVDRIAEYFPPKFSGDSE